MMPGMETMGYIGFPYGVYRVSILGIIILVLGRYLSVGYLDPLGNIFNITSS